MSAKTTAVKKKARVTPARWNQTRQQIFLETLAACSNVAASERQAGMSPGSAYRQRARSDEFRAAWAVALKEGYERLELGMLERAMTGTPRIVRKGDEVIETTEYPERIQMLLYNAHRAAVTGVARGSAADAESARDRLARKLAEMNRRMGGEG